MDESLTQRRRVWDDGLRIVNHCREGRIRRKAGDGTSKVFKINSINGSFRVKPGDFTTDLLIHLRTL